MMDRTGQGLASNPLTLSFTSTALEGEYLAEVAKRRWPVLLFIFCFDISCYVFRISAKCFRPGMFSAVPLQFVCCSYGFAREFAPQLANMAVLYFFLGLLNKRSRRLGDKAARQEELLLSACMALAICNLLASLRADNCSDYVYVAFFLICTSTFLKIRWWVGTLVQAVPTGLMQYLVFRNVFDTPAAALGVLALGGGGGAGGGTAGGACGAMSCGRGAATADDTSAATASVAAGGSWLGSGAAALLPPEAGVHVAVAWAVGGLMAYVVDWYRRQMFAHSKLAAMAYNSELTEAQARIAAQRALAAAQAQAAQRALSVAREKAANEAKSDFMSLMCHEVRTPLNGCLASAEMLLETPLQAEQRELAATIRVSGSILLSTVSNFLDFFKLEAGKALDIVRTAADLRGLVADVQCIIEAMLGRGGEVALLQPQMQGLRSHRVYCDADRVRGILLNLYTNAAKFTRQGHIQLTVREVPAGYTPPPLPDFGTIVVVPPAYSHREAGPAAAAAAALQRQQQQQQPGAAGVELQLGRPAVGGTLASAIAAGAAASAASTATQAPPLRTGAEGQQPEADGRAAQLGPSRLAVWGQGQQEQQQQPLHDGAGSSPAAEREGMRAVCDGAAPGTPQAAAESLGCRECASPPSEAETSGHVDGWHSPASGSCASPCSPRAAPTQALGGPGGCGATGQVCDTQAAGCSAPHLGSAADGAEASAAARQPPPLPRDLEAAVAAAGPGPGSEALLRGGGAGKLHGGGATEADAPGAARWLLFEVADTGIGISQEGLNTLFREYVQGTEDEMRKPRSKGGTGLGLAICSKQVGVLGGRIGAYSCPGRGSVFWFTIPLIEAPPADEPYGDAAGRPHPARQPYQQQQHQQQAEPRAPPPPQPVHQQQLQSGQPSEGSPQGADADAQAAAAGPDGAGTVPGPSGPLREQAMQRMGEFRQHLSGLAFGEDPEATAAAARGLPSSAVDGLDGRSPCGAPAGIATAGAAAGTAAAEVGVCSPGCASHRTSVECASGTFGSRSAAASGAASSEGEAEPAVGGGTPSLCQSAALLHGAGVHATFCAAAVSDGCQIPGGKMCDAAKRHPCESSVAALAAAHARCTEVTCACAHSAGGGPGGFDAAAAAGAADRSSMTHSSSSQALHPLGCGGADAGPAAASRALGMGSTGGAASACDASGSGAAVSAQSACLGGAHGAHQAAAGAAGTAAQRATAPVRAAAGGLSWSGASAPLSSPFTGGPAVAAAADGPNSAPSLGQPCRAAGPAPALPPPAAVASAAAAPAVPPGGRAGAASEPESSSDCGGRGSSSGSRGGYAALVSLAAAPPGPPPPGPARPPPPVGSVGGGRPPPRGDFGRLSGRRVLLVEDNLINQTVATKMLASLGMRAELASNGLEAVRAVERVMAAAAAAAGDGGDASSASAAPVPAQAAAAAPAQEASAVPAAAASVPAAAAAPPGPRSPLAAALAGARGARAPPSNEPFDVILMDMAMPVMGGVDATRAIRRLGCRVPILAMTANASDRDRDECRVAGMDGFLSKPVLKDQLADSLLRVLDGAGWAHTDGSLVSGGED